jgi:hypothetical protein
LIEELVSRLRRRRPRHARERRAVYKERALTLVIYEIHMISLRNRSMSRRVSERKREKGIKRRKSEPKGHQSFYFFLPLPLLAVYSRNGPIMESK